MKWHEYFYYDPSSKTGLRNKEDRYGGWNNSVIIAERDAEAGSFRAGYARVSVNSTDYPAHRVIYEMFHGTIPDGMLIDHINGNKRDNRIENLRLATSGLNAKNRPMQRNNLTGVTGVSLHKAKGHTYWRAQWKGVDGKVKVKGFSVTAHGSEEAFELACKARDGALAALNTAGAGYTERHGHG